MPDSSGLTLLQEKTNMNLKRKLRSGIEDIREYHIVKALRFIGNATFWSLAFVVAFVTLPLSERLRKFITNKASQAIGKLFWHLRGANFLREWLPPMRNLVLIEHRDQYGNLKMADYGFNLRTDVGRSWQCHRMGNASPPASAASVADYISVHSGVAYTPNTGDTMATWETNEETGFGFSRQQGTFAHTEGTAIYSLVKSYTATGTVTIYGAALINEGDSTSERPFCIKNFGTEASLENNDTLQVTWSITV